MTTFHKRFARWRRLRPYQPRTTLTGILIAATVGLVLLALWLLTLSGRLLAAQVISLRDELAAVQFKLHDTEVMLIRCFDGGTAAYSELTLPSGQVVREYHECPQKVERRIYP